ncbi:alpha/beta hydrolase [Streptomyces sp. NPDC005708]|uniref:alpha/beta hydrolase n=1 Tax=Streptomyces sp. NPDC005708 TaxID=3154564 RepID=UPI0034085F60
MITPEPIGRLAWQPPPPLDPELEAALVASGERALSTGITADSLERARATLLASVPSLEQLAARGVFDVEEHQAPSDAGAVPLLVLRPRAAASARPILYFTHGGGLMMGNSRYGLGPVLRLAAELEAVVVSVDYRLAPEHRFPAGLDDAYAGLRWTTSHAVELSGNPRRIVLVGASAGGNLAAALAMLARDRREVEVLGQLLMYPMLDDRNDSLSAHQMTGRGVWDRVSNETGWASWLGDSRHGRISPYAAPARSQDLSGLPPAFLDVGSAETFRDEVVAYAERIWAAGGAAELHVWAGAVHGFDLLAPKAAVSRDAHTARLRWLGRLLRSDPSG